MTAYAFDVYTKVKRPVKLAPLLRLLRTRTRSIRVGSDYLPIVADLMTWSRGTTVDMWYLDRGLARGKPLTSRMYGWHRPIPPACVRDLGRIGVVPPLRFVIVQAGMVGNWDQLTMDHSMGLAEII